MAVAWVAGDLARAHAVWAAVEYGSYYLTCEPELAPALIAPDQIHRIRTEDG